MSWIKNAVNKAVEVSGKNNITRTVKNYADSVVHHAGQAVAGGAKIIQDRMAMRNYKSFKQTVRRLEEAAVTCRGKERVLLLRRWLGALKEFGRPSGDAVEDRSVEQPQDSDDPNSSAKNAPPILFFDSDMGGEPVNFEVVFLHSQALELVILSMILEAPNEEEVSLLLEIFGICFTGGKEVHNAVVSSIQDLAKAFSGYQEEVLVKHEELLQFARSAISGLKLDADIARVDFEASKLQQKVDGMEALLSSESSDRPEKKILSSVEALQEALAEVRTCSRLEALLLKKKYISPGDSAEIHCQKVDKLKVLADSLANSSSKAEKRIEDHRHQKEEALYFRAAKAVEVGEIEKELVAEITELEKHRDKIEAELKKVNISLSAAMSRLNKTREERDQFDEASNQIVVHLKTKEDELTKSISSCKKESDIVHTWINFLEDTWVLQSSYLQQKQRQTDEELEKCGNSFLKVVKSHLFSIKDELGPLITRIATFVENLKNFNGRSDLIPENDLDSSKESNPKRFLEEEYLSVETKIVTAFGVVDHMKKLFYMEHGNMFRINDLQIKELFNEIDKMRAEFESIERPTLDIELPEERTTAHDTMYRSSSRAEIHEEMHMSSSGAEIQEEKPAPVEDKVKSPVHTSQAASPKQVKGKSLISSPKPTKHQADTESELAKLEEEFGEVNPNYSAEEIGGWEFDELEEELRAASPEINK